MRILLVAPQQEYPIHTPNWARRPPWLRLPQMSLLILRALTPPQHDVLIVEEEQEAIAWKEKWDLVGLTVMTATAPRAYHLAQRFREAGAKVILGGIHPTVLPQEAQGHADALLVGEAEPVWEQIVADAARGELQPRYGGQAGSSETLQVPIVHYAESNHSGPVLCPVITSRGCPYRCDFCSVSQIYGSRVRHVAISRVLEQAKKVRRGYVAFLDDNLTTDREYARELFQALHKLRLQFIAQVPLRFILDEDLFAAAVAAGLKGILVGFESIAAQSLARLRKTVPLAAAADAVKRARQAKVMLNASFIFGLEEHDRTIFAETLDFILRHQIPSVTAYVLTPYPGTVVFDRLAAAGRLLHREWAFYDHVTPVFQPKGMSLEELATGYLQFRTTLFSFRGIARRFRGGWP
jgi:radical SAM superfamily enzyme YgiQ (UPF0313 family)